MVDSDSLPPDERPLRQPPTPVRRPKPRDKSSPPRVPTGPPDREESQNSSEIPDESTVEANVSAERQPVESPRPRQPRFPWWAFVCFVLSIACILAPPQIAAQYSAIAEAGPVWMFAYFAVIGLSPLLFLVGIVSVAVYVIRRLQRR